VVMFWVFVSVISTLLYVLLDGFDLGVGILFGLTRSEARRHAMFVAVAPIWDGNETWLVVTGVVLWGAFPIVYATLMSAFYLPLLADSPRRGVRVSPQNGTDALGLGSRLRRRVVGRNVHPGCDRRCARGRPSDH
jgi:bd-type cytochrome oxidase subunit II